MERDFKICEFENDAVHDLMYKVITKNKYWLSWGGQYKGKATFEYIETSIQGEPFNVTASVIVFSVNGFVLKGDLFLLYDRGTDTFQLWRMLSSNPTANIIRAKLEMDDLYIDELVGSCDRAIERGNMTDDEYQKAVSAWMKDNDLDFIRNFDAVFIDNEE